MRKTGMLGIVVAALVSGCAFETGEPARLPAAEPTQKAESEFEASLFKFSVWVNDNGLGEGGGWQRASTVLKFVDTRSAWFGVIGTDEWNCPLTVSMPIRSKAYGIIPPELAAQWSAAVAVAASAAVMNSRPRWIGALFCPKFAEKMVELFKNAPGGAIGARVTSP
jgi:hypothetical protein